MAVPWAEQKFHFILPVWGAKYIGMFLDYALPSHLSDKNLGGLKEARRNSVYRIYTTTDGKAQIEGSAIFVRLQHLVPTEFYIIDEIVSGKEGRTFGLGGIEVTCHRHAIQKAEEQDAGFVVLNPDAIWADGTFETVFRQAAQGKNVVTAPSLRVNQEPFFKILEKIRAENRIEVTPRLLVCHSLDNLHALSLGCCFDAKEGNSWAGHLYWRIGNAGLVARIFYTHLLYCRSKMKGFVPEESYDYDWMYKAIPNLSEYYFITDSDEGFAASLTPIVAKGWMPEYKNFSSFMTLLRKAAWVKRHAKPFNYQYFEVSIRIHVGPITDEWLRRERVATLQAALFRWFLDNTDQLRTLEKMIGIVEKTAYAIESQPSLLLKHVYESTRLSLGPYLPAEIRQPLKRWAERVVGLEWMP